MLVLGIESSCDDTGLALVNEKGVVASYLSSQVPLHALFGGVVPELASREHARLMPLLFDSLMSESGMALSDIDRIAVTRGPGLLGCLLVGLSFAKGLSFGTGIPLIGVNHLHAHLLAAGLEHDLVFPSLGILVSGGHTHLLRMESPVHMQVLGRTIDDAAGEACDKFAKIIGLPYPGGALLDRLASFGCPDPHMFPRPYTRNEHCDFSFSGLKTAAKEWAEEHPEARVARLPAGGRYEDDVLMAADPALKDAAASFLQAVAETIRIKAERAAALFAPKSLYVAGGVAANSFVRRESAAMAEALGVPLCIPSPKLCTDNGAMVAYSGYLLAKCGCHHDLGLSAVPRGKLIPEDWIIDTVD